VGSTLHKLAKHCTLPSAITRFIERMNTDYLLPGCIAA
jgi:hypothetical protein